MSAAYDGRGSSWLVGLDGDEMKRSDVVAQPDCGAAGVANIADYRDR